MPREANPANKERDLEHPYETWKAGDWEWRVLKKWQSPSNESKNPYARWFCAVRSPMTYGSWEIGDVYVKDIKAIASIVEGE